MWAALHLWALPVPNRIASHGLGPRTRVAGVQRGEHPKTLSFLGGAVVTGDPSLNAAGGNGRRPNCIARSSCSSSSGPSAAGSGGERPY